MKLADCVAQCRSPLAAEDFGSGRVTLLNGAAECAALVTRSPIRYVLADDLTRLCTELAYSRGARNLACADLLHVPAQLLWVEWCNGPWREVPAFAASAFVADFVVGGYKTSATVVGTDARRAGHAGHHGARIPTRGGGWQ